MVKLSVPQRLPTIPASRIRAGALVGSVAALVAGCAQEPLPPAGTPDNCILLCALVRSIFNPPEPTPAPPPPKPAKIVKPAHAAKPVPAAQQTAERRKAGPAESDAVAEPSPTALPLDLQPRTDETVVSRSNPPPPPAQPVPLLGYTQLPGSVPIEENTSHFEPLAADRQ